MTILEILLGTRFGAGCFSFMGRMSDLRERFSDLCDTLGGSIILSSGDMTSFGFGGLQ